MKKSLLFAMFAGVDLVAALVFFSTGSTAVAVALLALAVVVGLFAFLQWRRGL